MPIEPGNGISWHIKPLRGSSQPEDVANCLNIQIDQSLFVLHPRFPHVLSATLIRRGATSGFGVGQQFRTAVQDPCKHKG